MSKGISSWLIVRRQLTCRFQTPPTWRTPHAATLSNRSVTLSAFHTQVAKPQYAKAGPGPTLGHQKHGCYTPTSIGLGCQLPLHGSHRCFTPLNILERHRASLNASQNAARWLLQSDQYSSNSANRKNDVQGSSPGQPDGHKTAAGLEQSPGATPKKPLEQPGTEAKDHEQESIAASMSKYLNLPMMHHRPTKEELLAAANGFWERFKVRFKWISIRSMRPWNIDEWGAFVSWFMLGHIVWILVGTTTFFSILIFSINTVFAQGMSIIVLSPY